MSLREISRYLIRAWILLVVLTSVAVYTVDKRTNKQSNYTSEVSFLYEPQLSKRMGNKVRFKKRWVTLNERNTKRVLRFLRDHQVTKLKNVIGGSTFRSKILLDSVIYRGSDDLLVNHMIGEVRRRRQQRKRNNRPMKLKPIGTSVYSELTKQERTQLGMIGMMLFQTEDIDSEWSNGRIISLRVKTSQYDLTEVIVDVLNKRLPEMMEVSSSVNAAREVREILAELGKELDATNRTLARSIDRNNAVTSYVSTTNVQSITRNRRLIREEIALYEDMLSNMSTLEFNSNKILTPLSEVSGIYKIDPPYVRNVILAVLGSFISYLIAVMAFVFLNNIINDARA